MSHVRPTLLMLFSLFLPATLASAQPNQVTREQIMFLVVILGTTHKRAPVGFAGLAIGLALTLIHLISIPVTNTSVNPARSTATALFVGGWAVQQLWLFWLAPVIGAALAGFTHKLVLEGSLEEPPVTGRTSVTSARAGSASHV